MSEVYNDPVHLAWKDTLQCIDDLMQLGLLEHLKSVSISRFENNKLYLATSSDRIFNYLTSSTVLSHVYVLARPCFEKHGLELNELVIEKIQAGNEF
ncbi:MAG: hypothetical protein NZT61_04415 [Deltaproteobacteria bacterium]|nr:hypothetical protein [Deltaproteobacteria bacterium]MCX7952587.1 hypothetical protein [Deltaproteobacteria bacterium]